MTQYFERSMKIREEIINSHLMDKLREYWFTRDNPFYVIKKGNKAVIYSIGQLESGIHVALRKYRGEIEKFWSYNVKINWYERFCQRNETRSDDGTVSFCIGINFDNVTPAILTEDLSKGLELKQEEFTYTDLDDFVAAEELKYFSENNIIKITATTEFIENYAKK